MVVCGTCGEANPERARFCSSCGAALSALEAGSRETRKTVTVVFADITGSTAMGERQDPETTRALLARYFAAMREVLEGHGGTVEKFIGDAVMAVFGVPTLHEDDALRAVRAASDMRARLAEFNAASGATPLQMHVGVSTGEVVAGSGGNQLLVTGDIANVASRLENAAAPGEILIGAATQALVHDAVTSEPVEPLALKGKADPVPAFRLLAVSPGQRTRLDRFDAPLVGRQRELHMLHEALERAGEERAVHLFTLLGEPGVGKSRLVHEFLASTGDRATALRGRCLPYGEGITYWPIGEVVRSACGISDADPRDVAGAKLLARLGDLPRAEEIASHVAAAIGLSEATPPREQIFWAIRRLLEHLAAERPLVLVLDDLQWAEPTLVELVEHLVEWGHAPILLLVMARPELLERPGGWASATPNATTLRLEPLTTAESSELIGSLAGAEALPAALRERVTAAAEGNPLFVEEFVAMLRDTGRIGDDVDGHLAGDDDLAELAVPPSIAALLGARLDALGEAAREAIGRAAVIGETFAVAELGALTPDPERDALPGLLHGLLRRGLLRPDPDAGDEDAYRFGHLLVRDAAYAALPKQRRADLHEEFGSWLEATAGERLAELEPIIAHHLEAAYRYRVELGTDDQATRDLAERAIGHLDAAARRARERGDAPATAELFGRAVELAPPGDRRRARWLFDVAMATTWNADVETVERIYARMRDEADAAGATDLVAAAELRLIRQRLRRDPGATASQLEAAAQRVADAIRESADPLLEMVYWFTRSLASSIRLRFGDQAEHARRMLDAADRAQDPWSRRGAANQLQAALFHGPMPTDEVLEELIRLGAEVDEPLPPVLFVYLGRVDEARQMIADRRAAAEELGNRGEVMGSYWEAADLAFNVGDYATAERNWRVASEMLDADLETIGNSTVTARRAAALVKLGRVDEAAEASDRSERMTAADDITSQALWRMAKALVAAARDDHGEAEGFARAALEILRPTDALDFQGDAHRTLADVLDAAGRHDEAVAERREALRLFEQKKVLPKVARLREQLAKEPVQ